MLPTVPATHSPDANSPATNSLATHSPDTASTPLRTGERAAYILNAGLAWLGVILVAVLSTLDQFDRGDVEPGLYGGTPEGAPGAAIRLLDTLSYFTIWSNIVVAIALTLLALNPRRDTPLTRVLRLDSVLMITITAIVYAVLLAPITEVTGWSIFTNPLQHIVVPALTVLVWIIYGPRGWISWRTVIASLAIPLIWIVWMMGRGAITGTYPYGFANVAQHGYVSVFTTLAMILAFGLVIATVFWALDRLLIRLQR